jgi:hypothetical protein
MALDVIDFSAEGLPAYVVKENAAGRPAKTAVPPHGWRQIEQVAFNGM